MSAASVKKPGMTRAVLVVMLTLLLGIQPITTDLYLPALPTLQRGLGASVSAAQLTLSALIICFGFGQLVCGPLADRYGRRPVLLVGMALYTLASVLAALAPGMGWLIAWRALQGAAMAAAVTCGRSIVRDLYEPHEGARMMSRALGGLGLIAFASPLLGGVIAQWLGWRAALLVLALFGAVTLAFVAWRLEETIPRRNPQATRIAPLLAAWRHILGHPTFIAYALLLAASYGGLFIFLAGSSFVYIEVLGRSRTAYGAIVAMSAACYIVGTVLCRRLLSRYGLRRTVAVGGVLSLGGGATLAALSLAGLHEVSVWTVIVPQWVYMLGHGVHQPCGQAGAVGPFPDKAGTAASLSGFGMTLGAFALGVWLGRGLNGTVYPLTLGIGACSALVATVAWTLVQRHGDPRPTPIAQPA